MGARFGNYCSLLPTVTVEELAAEKL